MKEPTEREWLEGVGERFEREHEVQHMSDLRSACIEAMAEALPNRCAFVEDATPAFDALLGVLEEHADEERAISIPTDVRGLLAVLREETQE